MCHAMSKSSKVFKAGTRTSNLALRQTRSTLDRIEAAVPGISFEMVHLSSPGDRDKNTDLRATPGNFFTEDLDQAVLDSVVDCAIHSAKDIPDEMPAGLDWVWLPWHEDPRDVIVLPSGMVMEDIPSSPRIGVSSQRREDYCKKTFPGAELLPIRGNMEERLDQLDSGQFDLLVTAAAAMVRLDLAHRISEHIPLSDLNTPAGQGWIAITFRADDIRFRRLRSLFVKSVTFVGAGIGDPGNITRSGAAVLSRCDVCLRDSLIPEGVMAHVPDSAEIVHVGKRMGAHSVAQASITDLIAFYAKQGKRVVRLKGGDPCIFGRLAEEVAGLEQNDLPYRVIPGISTLSVASAASGMLLTRRGVAKGFSVLTPRKAGGELSDISEKARLDLPLVFYMATKSIKAISEQLQDEGMSPDTPCAVIFDAGGTQQETVTATISTIDASLDSSDGPSRPGLVVVGEVASFAFDPSLGALRGQRVLLTCSDALQESASSSVLDLGGVPLSYPLIRLVADKDALPQLSSLDSHDWLIVTSPSSADILLKTMVSNGIDLRTLPRLMVTGRGTAREFEKHGIMIEAMPDSDFSTDAVIELASRVIEQGSRVFRARSAKAGPAVADALRANGMDVTDCIIYQNVPIEIDSLPSFDAVYFASSSAAETFLSTQSPSVLKDKLVVSIGRPTAQLLQEAGIDSIITPPISTTKSAIHSLAGCMVSQAMEEPA